MSVAGYKFTALTGGGAGALDAQDGAGLGDGDIAMVMLTSSGYIYWYELDVDSGEAESSPNIIAPDTNAGLKRWKIRRQPVSSSVPVGAVIPFIGGYFTNGSNAGFTNVIGNTASAINTLYNADGFYVANGAACNVPGSLVYDGAGRYLPNLTDDRFLMGDTAAGTIGGTATHQHSTGSFTLTTTEIPSHTHAINGTGTGGGTLLPQTLYGDAPGLSVWTQATGSGAAHNHGNTGSTNTLPTFLSCWYLVKVI